MNSPGPGDQCNAKFTSDTPHFFKIILDDTDIQKLRIPKKFGRKNGSEISSSVSLKVPNGESWKVELTKCADGTWLHNGWSEFAKHYSLSYGSFLVFRHEGNNNFNVIIFDKSATEISYPYSGTPTRSAPNCDRFQDHALEDNSDGIRVRPSKKSRVRSPSPSASRRPDISTRHSPIKSSAVKAEISENPNLFKVDSATRSCRKEETLRVKERTDALQLASSFKSTNPFFVILMQPSYIYDKLSLPVKFCKDYLPNHTGNIFLSICHRKTRPVVLSFSARPKLCGGWKEFVKENRLEVGDVCVFELINQTTMTFNIVIFQDAKNGLVPGKRIQSEKVVTTATKDGASGKSSKKKSRSRKSTAASSSAQGLAFFKSENPFFQITATPSSVYYVAVPYLFIREHVKRGEAVKLEVEHGGKLWPVKLLLYPERKIVHLGCGWSAFASENSVKVGNVCAFELINKEDALFRVHIFRN